MDLSILPPRIPASKVCEIAGYSKSVLSRRISSGRMPRPVDRAKENLFLTSAVLERLGLVGEIHARDSFDKVPDVY